MATLAPGEAPGGAGRVSASAAAVLEQTRRHWDFRPMPVPRDGWLRCGFCGSEAVVVRGWQYHTRPGTPTVPRRCDVHVKCAECAAGWWHGVAVSEDDWNARPRPVGIRALLMRGSNFEPRLWSSYRGGRARV